MKHNPAIQRLLAAISIVLGIALGVGGMVAGEADDSPGLQLIGVILIVAALALAVRLARRSPRRRRTRR
jgi:uncharacterized membrane protein YfcA